MVNKQKSKDHIKAKVTAILIGVIMFSITVGFSFYELNRIKQEGTLHKTEDYIFFDNTIRNMIYSKINLIKGAIAYIQSTDDLSDEEFYNYMDNLLSENDEIIKNVGVIYGTTIHWNYPYEENKASIGIDLSTIEAQKPYIERVQNTMKPVFQGPVDLVQGGRGFIIRYPFSKNNDIYFGHVSVVLKEEVFNQVLANLEESLNVSLVIKDENKVIYGMEEQSNNSLQWFEFEDGLLNWQLGLSIDKQPFSTYINMIIYIFIGIILLAGTSIFSFVILRANDVIKNESIHDHLTGLRNRNSLDETIKQVFASAERNNHDAGILVIDLNRFKDINDTYGHIVGDEVLKETAYRLKQAIRTDEIPFRIGGDEFLIVIPYVHEKENLQQMKKRLKGVLSYKLEVNGYSVLVTASIGYAVYPKHGLDFDMLFTIADEQMYVDKSTVI
jgi:diguanylate cyclase (GGDEF)-like protein